MEERKEGRLGRKKCKDGGEKEEGRKEMDLERSLCGIASVTSHHVQVTGIKVCLSPS